MANFSVGLCSALTFFTFIMATSVAEEFKVGGDDGWRPPAASEAGMYGRWAAASRLHVGDSLRFEYKNDTVVVVDKWGYYHCNSSRAAAVFKNGDTVMELRRPGPVYFITANLNHCRDGQRLVVEVMARPPPGDASPAPSPSAAGSFFMAPQFVFCYVVVILASMNM